MTLITFPWTVDGVPTDAASVVFRDPTDTYGLKRSDTDEVLVPSGTSLSRDGPGLYSYFLSDPASNIYYDYWIEVVYQAQTYRIHFTALSSGVPEVSEPVINLTSRGEIARLYSTIGVDLRLEDSPKTAGKSDIINEIVAWASDTVASYTLHRYDTEDLVSSPWVRRRATILGAYYLSMRRANAPQFVSEAKRVLEDLALVRTGEIIIPGVPVRSVDTASLSSYRIDDRYFQQKQRVWRSQSTNPYPGQRAYEHPYSGGELF